MKVKELNGSHIGEKVNIWDKKNMIQIEGILRNIEHSGNGRTVYTGLGEQTLVMHNLTTMLAIGTIDRIYIDPEGEAQVIME